MKPSESKNLFLNIYLGEFVSILVDYDMMEETEQGVKTQVVTIEGYVLDSDSKFLHLSDNGTEVCKSVNIDYIITLSLSAKGDGNTDMLNDIPFPVNPKDIN